MNPYDKILALLQTERTELKRQPEGAWRAAQLTMLDQEMQAVGVATGIHRTRRSLPAVAVAGGELIKGVVEPLRQAKRGLDSIADLIRTVKGGDR